LKLKLNFTQKPLLLNQYTDLKQIIGLVENKMSDKKKRRQKQF